MAVARGAACQKHSHAVRTSTKGNVKVSCFTCGAWYYASAAQIREGCHPCRCGAGVMLPASPAACFELTPDRVMQHPDCVEELARHDAAWQRQHNGGQRKIRAHCGACGAPVSHHRSECPCGFDNGAQAYREGAAFIPQGRPERPARVIVRTADLPERMAPVGAEVDDGIPF